MTRRTGRQLYLWPGGTFALNGAFSFFEEVYLFGCDTGDIDHDGIPNGIDPHPNNPSDGSLYHWDGGDYFINGLFKHFDSGWWTCGPWVIIGTVITFLPHYHATDAGDTDGDDCPDDPHK